MSSDRQDTKAVRQGTRSADKDLYATPHLAGQQDQVADYPETDPPSSNEGDLEESSEQLPTRLEVLSGHMRQLSPVLAPLFFGGVTFLFILPFVLNTRAYLSTFGSLPTGLILLAIGVVLLVFALAQGIMLYYAGPNDVFWTLGMVGGFSLFLLTGCFAIFGPTPSIFLLVILTLLGFLLVRLFIRPTPEGQVDIVEVFGKHSRTLFPGLNFVAPWEKIVSKLDTRVRVWSCPIQRVPVSRSEEVQLAATISYQLMPDDAYLAALYVSNWEKSFQELFVSAIQEVVGDLSPEDLIAWPPYHDKAGSISMSGRQGSSGRQDGANWDRINAILTVRMQELVAQWGVQVNEVHIRDVALIPHIPQLPEGKPVPGIAEHPPEALRERFAGASRQADKPRFIVGPSPQPVSAAQPASAKPNQVQPRPKNAQPLLDVPQTSHADASRATAKAQLAQVKAQMPASPPAPSPAPAPPPTPAATPKISKVEMLTDAYEAVRSGRITDPETIREIAAHFDSIANDHEESQKVDFDAARAARTLRDRAAFIEEQMQAEAEYDNETQPDWSISPSK